MLLTREIKYRQYCTVNRRYRHRRGHAHPQLYVYNMSSLPSKSSLSSSSLSSSSSSSSPCICLILFDHTRCGKTYRNHNASGFNIHIGMCVIVGFDHNHGVSHHSIHCYHHWYQIFRSYCTYCFQGFVQLCTHHIYANTYLYTYMPKLCPGYNDKDIIGVVSPDWYIIRIQIPLKQ